MDDAYLLLTEWHPFCSLAVNCHAYYFLYWNRYKKLFDFYSNHSACDFFTGVLYFHAFKPFTTYESCVRMIGNAIETQFCY